MAAIYVVHFVTCIYAERQLSILRCLYLVCSMQQNCKDLSWVLASVNDLNKGEREMMCATPYSTICLA